MSLCSNSMPANGRCLDYIQVSKRRPIVALRFSAGFSNWRHTRQVPYRDDPPISEINLNSILWLLFEKGTNRIIGVIVQQRWCVPSLPGLINIIPFLLPHAEAWRYSRSSLPGLVILNLHQVIGDRKPIDTFFYLPLLAQTTEATATVDGVERST